MPNQSKVRFGEEKFRQQYEYLGKVFRMVNAMVPMSLLKRIPLKPMRSPYLFYTQNKTLTSQLQSSTLHKIQTQHSDPMKLFKEWYSETIEATSDDEILRYCSVATASKNGDVSSRHLRLERLDDDGFVLLTDSRSYKSKQLAENPQTEMVFLWNTPIADRIQTRQTRIYGYVQKLSDDEVNKIFNEKEFFCKIRALVCHQGQPVSWDSMRAKHDDIVNKLRNETVQIQRPNYVISYKIFPRRMEFYESFVRGGFIGDRLAFTKTDSKWEMSRIAA